MTCTETVFIGKVKYVDPDKEFIPEGNALYPFVHKRCSFDYERELRAVFQPFPVVNGRIELDTPSPIGCALAVDVAKLVLSVFVAPRQPNWFREAVESVVAAFGPPGVRVVQSDLDRDPLY